MSTQIYQNCIPTKCNTGNTVSPSEKQERAKLRWLHGLQPNQIRTQHPNHTQPEGLTQPQPRDAKNDSHIVRPKH